MYCFNFDYYIIFIQLTLVAGAWRVHWGGIDVHWQLDVVYGHDMCVAEMRLVPACSIDSIYVFHFQLLYDIHSIRCMLPVALVACMWEMPHGWYRCARAVGRGARACVMHEMQWLCGGRVWLTRPRFG